MLAERNDRLFWAMTAAIAALVAIVCVLFHAAAPGPAARQPTRVTTAAHDDRRPAVPPSNFSPWARLRRAQIFARVEDDEAFKRLGEPEPGDWLWHFHEHGQTVEEYTAQVVNRKTPQRSRLHLLPYTDLTPIQLRVVEPMREHTAIFFDSETVVLPPSAARRSWLSSHRGQYDADLIVQDLARRVQPGSLGLFGLMGSDLYGLGLNFVFGEALLERRAGIYSVHRFGRDEKQLLVRALKLSAHEIGHLFGLQHCVFYECVMNGTNSLEETDRGPVHVCPVCLAKLQWNLRFDPARRSRALAAFYRKHGLLDEARFAEDRAGD